MRASLQRASVLRWGVALILAAVTAQGAQTDPIVSGRDYHSLANVDNFRVRHVSLALQVDFAAKRLSGAVDLTVQRTSPESSTLILDTRDLVVREVWWVSNPNSLRPLEFALAASKPPLGEALVITLPAEVPTQFVVRVSYQTRPTASGLQWLDASQTADHKHPFLYSQSQSIHARSWVPLQDSPQVRFTYDATIHVPSELRAVMSANNSPELRADGVYRFDMREPIPSYLLAIAVGRLDFAPLGPRTGVFAEPSILPSAASEFADTERMLETSERAFGKYRWGRYDMLILPPAFPFGGMENPRVTFVTPTLLAGDRSLVSLIAHEMAHSWSGNLVTNATWRDFWLNEGFTVFFERRIMYAMYGARRGAMEDALGFQTLERDLASLPPNEQILAIDLRGRDPDDGVTEIAYEKGRFFLGFIESRVGTADFDAFLRRYLDRFAFQSITTETFRAALESDLLASHPGAVTAAELDEWLYRPGLPSSVVKPVSDAFDRIDTASAEFLSGRKSVESLPTTEWTTQEWLHFLNGLPKAVPRATLDVLDRRFHLTQARNSEVAHAWLLIAIRNDYEPAWSRLESYLVTIGRRKLIVPLYTALSATPAGLARARAIYATARPGYHPITVTSVEAVLD